MKDYEAAIQRFEKVIAAGPGDICICIRSTF